VSIRHPRHRASGRAGGDGASVTPILLSGKGHHTYGAWNTPPITSRTRGVGFCAGRIEPHHPVDFCPHWADVPAKTAATTVSRFVASEWVAASTAAFGPGRRGAKISYGYQLVDPPECDKRVNSWPRLLWSITSTINRADGVVIATNAADRKFREAGVQRSETSPSSADQRSLGQMTPDQQHQYSLAARWPFLWHRPCDGAFPRRVM